MQRLVNRVNGNIQGGCGTVQHPLPVALVNSQNDDGILEVVSGFPHQLGVDHLRPLPEIRFAHAPGLDHFEGDLGQLPVETFCQNCDLFLAFFGKSRAEVLPHYSFAIACDVIKRQVAKPGGTIKQGKGQPAQEAVNQHR